MRFSGLHQLRELCLRYLPPQIFDGCRMAVHCVFGVIVAPIREFDELEHFVHFAIVADLVWRWSTRIACDRVRVSVSVKVRVRVRVRLTVRVRARAIGLGFGLVLRLGLGFTFRGSMACR